MVSALRSANRGMIAPQPAGSQLLSACSKPPVARSHKRHARGLSLRSPTGWTLVVHNIRSHYCAGPLGQALGGGIFLTVVAKTTALSPFSDPVITTARIIPGEPHSELSQLFCRIEWR